VYLTNHNKYRHNHKLTVIAENHRHCRLDPQSGSHAKNQVQTQTTIKTCLKRLKKLVFWEFSSLFYYSYIRINISSTHCFLFNQSF